MLISGIFKGGRTPDRLEQYSKIICLDLDKLPIEQVVPIKDKVALCEYTLAVFISPSGLGLKVLVKVSSGSNYHKDAYKQVLKFYTTLIGRKFDEKTSDINRLTFLSYDPDIYDDPDSTVFEVETPVKAQLQRESGDDNNEGGFYETTLSGQGFEALFNLIQALRDQDESLAEWIDGINLGAARGRVNTEKSPGKIIINLPLEIGYDEFLESLILKIAEVNKNPSGTTGIGSKLGKNERKGNFSRLFKTICDYTPDRLKESLIEPTFKLIKDLDAQYLSKDLKLNNNNISHCQRLGLIKKIDNSKFLITQLGKQYSHSPDTFGNIMKNQMMLFGYEYENGVLYPYRLAFQYMKAMKQINYIQFVYGLYSIQFTIDGTSDIESAINISKMIQIEFPNIELTNEVNKVDVLIELNKYHPVGYSYQNVWTDRTTIGNQFRYLVRHLELFDNIFYYEEGYLKVIPDSEELIDEILNKTLSQVGKSNYGNQWWIN